MTKGQVSKAGMLGANKGQGTRMFRNGTFNSLKGEELEWNLVVFYSC